MVEGVGYFVGIVGYFVGKVGYFVGRVGYFIGRVGEIVARLAYFVGSVRYFVGQGVLELRFPENRSGDVKNILRILLLRRRQASPVTVRLRRRHHWSHTDITSKKLCWCCGSTEGDIGSSG